MWKKFGRLLAALALSLLALAPGQPDGQPYVARDGLVNPERESPDHYDEVRLGRMVRAVTNLSLAYYLTGQEEYAAKAAAFLRTWFLNRTPG